MLPLTIKHLDEKTTNWINLEARKRSILPEQLISELLHELVSTKQVHSHVDAHDDLSDLAGTWSNEKFEEFVLATDDFDKIDNDLWP